MEVLGFVISYLIYACGILGCVALISHAFYRMKQLSLRSELLHMLIEKDYETDNIDLNKYL